MSSWEEADGPEIRAMLDKIVRSAVEYGFLRGLDHARRALASTDGTELDRAVESPWLRSLLASEAAEAFVRKLHVEELTG